jgi:Aerotolerance regulator N-terminal
MFLANPWALLALLAVPTLAAIYFLQRKSRVVLTSTLFLLEPAWQESVAGRRFERFRNAAPFWLQLLAVLLLAWVLVGPRYVRNDSVLRVAVVLDSSVSMQASRTATVTALATRLGAIEKLAARVEWVLLESDRERPTLYTGGDLGEALAALAGWQPWSGGHDPGAALRAAMAAVGAEALVMFVTDRAAEVPEGVGVFSAAEVLDNAGFTAPRLADEAWEVWVLNSGRTELRRKWGLDFGDGAARKAAGEITIAPGAAVALQGVFATPRVAVWIEPDRFTADDTIHLVRPEPKPLRVAVQSPAEFAPRFVATLEAVRAGESPADLTLAACDAAAPAFPPTGRAVLHVQSGEAPGRLLGGLVVAESHPLTAELNWQGLLVPDGPRFAPQPGDQPLVWIGEVPAIFLRPSARGADLLLNFDPAQANASRHPAFILLLHRFAEDVRRALPVPWRGNFEAGQDLALAPAQREGAKLHVAGGAVEGERMRAPRQPAFFEVQQGERVVLTGASHFADLPEADFRTAQSLDTVQSTVARLRERHSAEDRFAPLWVVLAIGAMLAGWSHPWRRR